ncbi:hypothetical protein V8F33_002835 [Rhypophila sp. PSN 637]
MVLQHGMFAGSQKPFATAIQYVIKVENGDRTPWSIEGETLEVPRRLQQLSRSNPGTGLPELHEQLLDRTPESKASPWSMLFSAVERLVKKRDKPVQRRGCEPYKVEIAHQEILTRALDQMGFAGIPMYRPTRLIAAMMTQARSSQHDYPNEKDMKETRERCHTEKEMAAAERAEYEDFNDEEAEDDEGEVEELVESKESEDDEVIQDSAAENDQDSDTAMEDVSWLFFGKNHQRPASTEPFDQDNTNRDFSPDLSMESTHWHRVSCEEHAEAGLPMMLSEGDIRHQVQPEAAQSDDGNQMYDDGDDGMQLDHQPPSDTNGDEPPWPQQQPSNAEDNLNGEEDLHDYPSCEAEDLAIRYPILAARIEQLAERQRQRQALLEQQPNHVQQLERLMQIQALEQLLERNLLEQLEQTETMPASAATGIPASQVKRLEPKDGGPQLLAKPNKVSRRSAPKDGSSPRRSKRLKDASPAEPSKKGAEIQAP